ncbi:MAG: hypothetical protein IKE91_03910 [Clostridia bacterium]|nr:hypothetical protein [Clostridia bacterium]
MKKERIKSIIAVGGIILAIMLILTGCGKEEKKAEENKNSNTQVQNTENTASNQEKKNETNNSQKNTTTNNTSKENNSTNNNTSTNKATTPSKLMVSREGMSEEVPSKEYSSTYGYTIRYATDNFKVSNHDDADWFECDGDINCVVVEKENKSYSKAIASISNYKKTTVNGYEAVYTSRFVEGQHENKYYVNTGSDCTYIITTSCQGDTEHMEGLEHIMDAMVQTFAIK